jgi:hypothetical protein
MSLPHQDRRRRWLMGMPHNFRFRSAVNTHPSTCHVLFVDMGFSIRARRTSTADGNVHIRRFCGPAVGPLHLIFSGLELVHSESLAFLTTHSARGKRRSAKSSASSAPAGFPAGAMAERWAAAYSGHVPSLRRHGRLGNRSTSPSTACRSRALTSPLVRPVRRPGHDQSCVDQGVIAADLSTGDPTPRSSALSPSGRPSCPAGRVGTLRRRAPLRARVEDRAAAPEPRRKRSANGEQTSANGRQTDQAHGVGEPDTHHDGRTT